MAADLTPQTALGDVAARQLANATKQAQHAGESRRGVKKRVRRGPAPSLAFRPFDDADAGVAR